jgi:hypothetical protein
MEHMHMQAREGGSWDLHSHDHSAAMEEHMSLSAEEQPLKDAGVQSFAVQGPVDAKALLRKVDMHLLPFFFSLALFCSVDRGRKALEEAHPVSQL